MYDSAGSHAEHAGMAVHTAHGDRGGSAAGGREKSALGRKERLAQRLPSGPSGHTYGDDVPHGS